MTTFPIDRDVFNAIEKRETAGVYDAKGVTSAIVVRILIYLAHHTWYTKCSPDDLHWVIQSWVDDIAKNLHIHEKTVGKALTFLEKETKDISRTRRYKGPGKGRDKDLIYLSLADNIVPDQGNPDSPRSDEGEGPTKVTQSSLGMESDSPRSPDQGNSKSSSYKEEEVKIKKQQEGVDETSSSPPASSSNQVQEPTPNPQEATVNRADRRELGPVEPAKEFDPRKWVKYSPSMVGWNRSDVGFEKTRQADTRPVSPDVEYIFWLSDAEDYRAQTLIRQRRGRGVPGDVFEREFISAQDKPVTSPGFKRRRNAA